MAASPKRRGEDADLRVGLDARPARPVPAPLRAPPGRAPPPPGCRGAGHRPPAGAPAPRPRLTMHCHAELRLTSPGQLKAARRRYKTFMIDEILSKETCDYFEKLSLYSVCPSLVVRPKPLHSCTGKAPRWGFGGGGALALSLVSGALPTLSSHPRARGLEFSAAGRLLRRLHLSVWEKAIPGKGWSRCGALGGNKREGNAPQERVAGARGRFLLPSAAWVFGQKVQTLDLVQRLKHCFRKWCCFSP